MEEKKEEKQMKRQAGIKRRPSEGIATRFVEDINAPGKGGGTYREEIPENIAQEIVGDQPGQEEIPGEEVKESSPGYIPGWENALAGKKPEEKTEKQPEGEQPGEEEPPEEDEGGGEGAFPSEEEIESQIEEAGAKERVSPMDLDFILILLFAVMVDFIDIILELTAILVIPKLIGIVIDIIVFAIVGGWMYWRTKKIAESKKSAQATIEKTIVKNLQKQVKKLKRLRKIGKVNQKVFNRYVRRYSQRMGKMGTSLAKGARSPFGRAAVRSGLAFLAEIIVILGLIPFWTIGVVLMLREK